MNKESLSPYTKNIKARGVAAIITGFGPVDLGSSPGEPVFSYLFANLYNSHIEYLIEIRIINTMNKIVVITGATSGIGKATAMGLAKMDYQLVVVARNKNKAEGVIEKISEKTGNSNIDLIIGDLGSIEDCDKILNEIKAKYDKIDVLINNAAILPRKRIINKEGREMQFAVNYLAPFYLTNKLLPLLEKSGEGRVVNVTGGIYKLVKFDIDNLEAENGYGKAGWDQYAHTKYLNIFFTYELARRLAGRKITSNCLHPGVIRTSLARDMKIFKFFNLFLSSPSKGARTSIYLATSPEVTGISGKYFIRSKQRKSTEITYDTKIAEKIWKMTENILDPNSEL